MTDTDTSRLTFAEIATLLDTGGVVYTRTNQHTSQEAVDVPGYGRIWYDDGKASRNPGWVVDNTETTGYSDPISEHELRLELAELCGYAETIRP